MEDLHQKYLKNKLTPEELVELRKEIGQLSRQELESRMEQEWLETELMPDNVPVANVRQIKEQLADKLRPVPGQKLYVRILRVAAILLIPLLMATTFYFYYTSSVVASHDMVVSAGKGERVSIVLPDGTKVRINALSTLSYDPVGYNKNKRLIRFEGEAYFEVARNEQVPFLISTNDMELEVLGTTFNLQARDYESDIEVDLIDGHVLLRSLLSHNKQELFENQKALLSKDTGKFTVIKMSRQEAIPWLSDEMIFNNKPLKEVIQAIETNFDVSFSFVGIDTLGQDRFTGTLPVKDLDEVLEILGKSYGFIYQKEGTSIRVSSE